MRIAVTCTAGKVVGFARAAAVSCAATRGEASPRQDNAATMVRA
ncbi:hypothetical protein [Rhodanobacter thiooxydans]|nr:hypothetical protein [Rhodanobacter thiooxydans]MCW0202272.1 hypothetical protein [Rhodanobacter thiooxydans]